MSVLYLVAAQASYNLTVRARGIRNSIEFYHTLFTCKLGAAKYDERAGPATNYSELRSWTVDNFSCGFYQAFSSPVLRKGPGNKPI